MTLNEFIHELEQLPREQYRFQIRSSGVIRCFVKSTCLCPMEALYVAKTGRRPVGICAASTSLGLKGMTTNRIVAAADLNRGHNPTLRARLLKALGLQEAA